MRNSFDISIVLYFLNFFIFKNISLLDENNWKSIIIFIVFAFLSCKIFRGYDKCKVYNALNESMLYNLFKNVYYKTRKTNSILNFTLKTRSNPWLNYTCAYLIYKSTYLAENQEFYLIPTSNEKETIQSM